MAAYLFLVEREELERQQFIAAVLKQVPAVIDDGLHLKIMQRPATLERREPRRLDEVAALVAAVYAGRMAAFIRGLHAVIARAPDIGAGDGNPTLAQERGRPFIGIAAVLAEKLRLQIADRDLPPSALMGTHLQ